MAYRGKWRVVFRIGNGKRQTRKLDTRKLYGKDDVDKVKGEACVSLGHDYSVEPKDVKILSLQSINPPGIEWEAPEASPEADEPKEDPKVAALKKMGKREIVSFIMEHGLDVNTDQSVGKMQADVIAALNENRGKAKAPAGSGSKGDDGK